MKIWTVDAFANAPFTGNPAAVVILDALREEALCQKIAAEMNLSETAFVTPINPSHFHIRWFTPKIEVKLCGHATLASAHILYTENYAHQEEIVFNSLSGPLKVKRSLNNSYTLDFPLQKTGKDLPHIQANFPESIAAVEAYDDVIVEFASEKAIRDYSPNLEMLEKIPCRGIIITAKGEKPYDFVSRFFAPKVGVIEDPVTGSAHCKLAHYWSEKLHKTDFLAYQASSRGGEIALSIMGDRAHITGKAITMLDGQFHWF